MSPDDAPGTPSLPDYIVENARSGRSRCKTCRRKIDKGVLRLGVRVEGPYGEGHMWHHLSCAARRRIEDVEAAWEAEAWQYAKEPPTKLPSLDELRAVAERAEERRRSRPTIPYVEVDPSGRARCKHCGEPIAKDSLRVVLGRKTEFGEQIRIGPIQVHPACVAAEMRREDCATEPAGFGAALRANSGVDEAAIDAVLREAGPLPGV